MSKSSPASMADPERSAGLREGRRAIICGKCGIQYFLNVDYRNNNTF